MIPVVVALFALGAVVVAVQRDSIAASVIAPGAALIASIAVFVRAMHSAGRIRAGWTLIGTAMLANASGDLIWQILLVRGHEPLGVSAADPPYLLTYPLLLAGIWLIVSAHAAVGRDILVDAAIVAAFAGLALWQFLVANPGLSSEGTLLERIVFSAYPLAGILTVAAIVAVVIVPARRPPAMMLLAGFGTAFLACDVLFAIVQNASLDRLRGTSDGSYLVAYGLLAAAALHESARTAWAPEADVETTFSGRRIALLGLALVGAPTVAVIAPMLDFPTYAPVYIAVALLVSFTILIRLVGLVRRLEVERRRLRETQRELAFRVSHDSLTELPNRAKLLETLHEGLDRHPGASGDGLAVMFIDLDNFKFVNDSLGHRAGDELLRSVGGRIRQSIKATDLVARIGGDEFVVLAHGLVDPHEAEMVASRILEALAGPFSLHGDVAYTAGSIGIALYADHDDAASLLRDADIALYQAKAAGGRCSRVFDETMRAWADERSSVETGLRAALDRGQLAVVYQPRVDLVTGHVRSLEALLRWPGRPAIPIPRLIEVAEYSGLIDAVGRIVLSQACRDIHALNDKVAADDPIGVAVNVSMRQIARSDFVESVRATIAAEAVEPALVALELTETFLAHEPERARMTLSALREIGVRLEIDDFGTGYSSLARLGGYPLDGIKIDRSFTAGLGQGGPAEQLVATIVGLARALALQVTAEGIETRHQAEVMRACGCDLGQGYLFARPMPMPEIVEFVRRAPLGVAAR